jgi:dynein heavy chain, axonemal
METILSIQPRVSAAASGKSPDEIVMDMATQFAALVPETLEESLGNQEHFELTAEGNMRSLSIVLLQEMAKFNILIRKMNSTLAELKKAIQGLAVMSQELDDMYLAFQNNVLPGVWKSVSYSSLKPLSSWFKDMLARVAFIREWLLNKAPLSYWMSGFYFPQGFLTGVLQSHARLYKIPIDTLSFKFKVLAIEKEKLTNAPEVLI